MRIEASLLLLGGFNVLRRVQRSRSLPKLVFWAGELTQRRIPTKITGLKFLPLNQGVNTSINQ